MIAKGCPIREAAVAVDKMHNSARAETIIDAAVDDLAMLLLATDAAARRVDALEALLHNRDDRRTGG